MTVTIHLRKRKPRHDSSRAAEPKIRRREARSQTTNGTGAARRGTTERLFFFLFLSLPVVTLIQSVFARTEAYAVTRQAPQETVLVGPRWAFVVPFTVSNKRDIERLIQCESGGQNVSRPDSDGITSDGILQYHRGPGDTLSLSTWEDFSRASGIVGSPKNPADAIRMADWAISHEFGPRWTCWREEGLSRGY
jgi:hypothetical protein